MNTISTKIDEINKLEILLLKRETKALEILYDQFSALLYGIALKMVKNEAKAEKLLKETLYIFFKEFSEKGVFIQSMQLRLIGIMRTIAQKNIVLPIQNQKPFFYVDNLNTPMEPENEPLFKNTGHKIPSMSDDQLNVLDLVFLGGGKINDVAKFLGIDESKVKRLLREALKNYRNAPHHSAL